MTMEQGLYDNLTRLIKDCERRGITVEEFMYGNTNELRNCINTMTQGCPDTIQGMTKIIESSLTLRSTMVAGNREEAVRCFYESRNMGKVILNKCRVMPSPIHGNGVFATCDIAAEEVITLYPSDIVTHVIEGQIICEVDINHPVMADGMKCMEYCLSSFGKDHGFPLVGDPTKIDNPTFLGHMCNDRVRCVSSKNEKAYVVTSLRTSNAGFFPLVKDFVAVVATKNIKRGEEIFVTYGTEYWKKIRH